MQAAVRRNEARDDKMRQLPRNGLRGTWTYRQSDLQVEPKKTTWIDTLKHNLRNINWTDKLVTFGLLIAVNIAVTSIMRKK